MNVLPQSKARTAMLTIGGGVGVAAAVAPDRLIRAFGVDERLSPAGRLGWRLFAARNIYLTARAVRGDSAAEGAFGPVQALDQVIFWAALSKGELPRRTALLAITASATIIALDRIRRNPDALLPQVETTDAGT